MKCEENCTNICNKTNGLCTCSAGFYNTNANGVKCFRCPSECQNGECIPISGQCHSCKAQKHGLFCERDCKTTCLYNECDSQSGICTKGCIDDFFGRQCEYPCSETCIDVANSTRCSPDNGQCLAGCIYGFTGHFCDQRSSKLIIS